MPTKTIYILSLFFILAMACKNAPERPEPILPEGYTPSTTTTTTTQPQTTTTPTEPAQNAAGVWHYTCPNGCAGGGASAIPCPNGCGATLAHNAAYHDNAGGGASSQTKTTIATSTDGVITPTGNAGAVTTSPTTPEPAQNAAGVWHYTCPNGCAGGAGSAIACAAGCGATLAHNAAYHQ